MDIALIGISGYAGSGKDAAGNFLVEDHRFTKIALADPLKRIIRDVYDFTEEQLWGPSQFRNAPDKRYPRPCITTGYGAGGVGSDGIGYGSAHAHCPDCQDTKITYLTPREALQTLGTEWGRKCYPNTWVDLCIRTAKKLLADEEARYHYQRGIYRSSGDPVSTRNSRARGVAVSDVRFRNEMSAIKEAGGKVIRVVRSGAGLKGAQGQHQSEEEQSRIPDSDFDAVIQNNGTLEDLRKAVKAFIEGS